MCEGKSPVGEAIPRQPDRTSVHLSVIKKMLKEEALLKKYTTGMPRDANELRQRYVNAMFFLLDYVEEELGVKHPDSPDILRAIGDLELMLHPFDYAMSREDFARDMQSVLSGVSVLDRFKPLRWENHR